MRRIRDNQANDLKVFEVQADKENERLHDAEQMFLRAERDLKRGKREIEREAQAEYDRIEREKQLAKRKTL